MIVLRVGGSPHQEQDFELSDDVVANIPYLQCLTSGNFTSRVDEQGRFLLEGDPALFSIIVRAVSAQKMDYLLMKFRPTGILENLFRLADFLCVSVLPTPVPSLDSIISTIKGDHSYRRLGVTQLCALIALDKVKCANFKVLTKIFNTAEYVLSHSTTFGVWVRRNLYQLVISKCRLTVPRRNRLEVWMKVCPERDQSDTEDLDDSDCYNYHGLFDKSDGEDEYHGSLFDDDFGFSGSFYEEAKDYAACSLDDCGYCGRCWY
ncbi:hypothetical protein GEMRC1_004447 [Eukaryota sp. GEM-RC1]